MASPPARNARVVAQPASASVRPAPHVRAVKLQLGGVWAQMHNQSVQGHARIAQLEENNSALTTELQSREVALDAYKEKLLQVETQLTEERMRRVEVERTAEKEREARGKEVLMHRELIGTLKEQVAELRETNLRTAQERHAAMEEEAAARGSMHAAILEKQRTEEELRLLVDRCEAAESEREQLRRRVDRLQANLDKTTTQRDNHCAHAEILLKEKNRYSKETSTLKKELEAMHRAACEEADALARSARAAASSQRPASRPQSATVAPLKENNRRVINTMAAHVVANATKMPKPAPHAFSHLDLPWTAERDGLVERVKGLEQDKAALTVRFKNASESRVRLEKTVKKLVARSSPGGSTDASSACPASPAAPAPEPLRT